MIKPSEARRIMGSNFMGPEELEPLSGKLVLRFTAALPPIPYSGEELRPLRRNWLLILGVPADRSGRPLTIALLKKTFGTDAKSSEPCFYPQDWYDRERFATVTTLSRKWYLVRKSVEPGTRGKAPAVIQGQLPMGRAFPSAILTAYAFFAYYLYSGGDILWRHDFLWCADRDTNADRIYTGRYEDPRGLSKPGFSVHRHLSIRRCYGLAAVVR